VNECKPLVCGIARSPQGMQMLLQFGRADELLATIAGMGLHSSTFQFDLSRFCH